MIPLPTGPFLGLPFRDLDQALAECHALGSDIETLRSDLLDPAPLTDQLGDLRTAATAAAEATDQHATATGAPPVTA